MVAGGRESEWSAQVGVIVGGHSRFADWETDVWTSKAALHAWSGWALVGFQ